MNNKPRQKVSTMDWIEPTRLAQNALHGALSRYVNGAVFSRSDLLRALLTPASVLRRHSGGIIRVLHAYREHLLSSVTTEINLDVEVYRGKNPYVHRMMEYVEQHLKQDVIGAYVHGSLGTYEEIAYSDFDALVILKSGVFESPARLVKVAERLHRAKTIMYEFDPLQHHGWFVLIEDDLPFYCEAYFPVGLFQYAKSLIENRRQPLSISRRDSLYEINDTFENVANSVVRKIDQNQYPTNIYQLKSLLSEFMLLPALYIQRKTGTGVFKKFCFSEARRDFDPDVWHIMDEASMLRQEWAYNLPHWQRRIASGGNALRNYLVGKWAPTIPHHMKLRLTQNFYARMRHLALQMRDCFINVGNNGPK